MVGNKPEQWRILTPIFSVLSPVIVGMLCWFVVRIVNEFDERNKEIVQQIRLLAAQQNDFQLTMSQKIAEMKIDNTEKYTELRYRCCSEIRKEGAL